MNKPTYIYCGDNLFHKLNGFVDKNLLLYLKSSKFKMFNSVEASSDAIIDDVYLGWSYIVYRIGNKYNHVGFSHSRGDSTEVFKNHHKNDLIVTCGDNEVFAASSDGKFYLYSTKNLQENFSTFCNIKQKVKTLATGDFQSLVLLDDGSVFTLKVNENSPLIPLHLQCPIIEIVCGKEHSILLSNFGQVFSYGCGSKGQLGHGTIENQDKPLLLEALDGIKINKIACGGWHSAAISDAGDLYMWGWNESGQLGFPCAELNSHLPLCEIETISCLPKIVDIEEEKQIVAVSCGTRHTAIMTEDFEVWTWGWNEYGQLGHDKYPLCDKPHKISLPTKFVPKYIKCAFWSTLISGILTV